MVIGRGRRGEHPQPTFCTTTTKKKVREKSTEKQVREKSTEKQVREKSTGKQSTGKKYGGKKYGGKSRDVTSGQACARYHFRLFPIAPPQMLLENRLYTTHIYTSNHKTF
jgi:hypothetical protein